MPCLCLSASEKENLELGCGEPLFVAYPLVLVALYPHTHIPFLLKILDTIFFLKEELKVQIVLVAFSLTEQAHLPVRNISTRRNLISNLKI